MMTTSNEIHINVATFYIAAIISSRIYLVDNDVIHFINGWQIGALQAVYRWMEMLSSMQPREANLAFQFTLVLPMNQYSWHQICVAINGMKHLIFFLELLCNFVYFSWKRNLFDLFTSASTNTNGFDLSKGRSRAPRTSSLTLPHKA